MHGEPPDVDDGPPMAIGGTLCLWRGARANGLPFPNECPCDRNCCLVNEAYWPDFEQLVERRLRLIDGGA